MSEIDVQIEKERDELYQLIGKYGVTAESVLKKSQQLNALIVLKQQEGLHGKILC